MIKIRKHTRDDIKYRVLWINNPKVNKFLGDVICQGTTLQKQKERFAKYEKSKNKKFFTICDDKKPIGWMGFSNISKINKNADIFLAIGDDAYRGKGIGKFSILWLIDYGFKKLHLHKINLGVIKDNIPAVNLYQSVGFIVEGEKKDEMFRKGKYYDLLLMALFKK